MIRVAAGPNYYGVGKFVKDLTDEFIEKNGDISVEKLDAQEKTADEIINSVQSTPFLSSKKLVVLSNLSSQKAIIENFDNFLEQVSETTELIIVEPKPDKRSTYFKSLKKLDGFNEFTELDELSLQKWVTAEANKTGVSISNSDVNYLVNRVGLNQEKLGNEFRKLVSFSKNITRETIDNLTEPTPQSSIFNLLDVAFTGNHKKTLQLYDDQRSQGVEPLNILGMMVWQMHSVALVDAAKTNNVQEITSTSGLKPFVVQKSLSISRNLGSAKISKILKEMVELDKSFKTVIIDHDTAMKNFLTTLAY